MKKQSASCGAKSRFPAWLRLISCASVLLVTACSSDSDSKQSSGGTGGSSGAGGTGGSAGSAGSGGAGGSAPITITEGTCLINATTADSVPDSVQSVPCRADFNALGSVPLSGSISGANSVKVVLDTADSDALYFQNSTRFDIHYKFVSTHLSGVRGLPIVTEQATFETTEYYTPSRRFVLGAVTYYDGPKAWTLEISPYDTANAGQITRLYNKVKAAAYFGPALKFHPTSASVEAVAKQLPADVKRLTSDEIYANTVYQPLTIGSTVGRLVFAQAATVDKKYLGYQDIVVLDEAPNDISVVAGLVTEEFQTPLSHINVLSQNRHTPNMGLRNAFTDPTLRALEGKWVEFAVAPDKWTMTETTAAAADAYWKAHTPTPVVLPALDLMEKRLLDIQEVTPETAGTSLRDAIKKSVLAFGGKAAQYSILAKTEGVPIPKAFAIPMFYYDQFMRDNGLFAKIDALLADAAFLADPAVRESKLAEVRAEMMLAPVNEAFQTELKAKIAKDYPNLVMRFRTSTNSEDLEGFPCAGCYESQSGDPKNWDDVLNAIRGAWSSIWLFRTFEERKFYGIDHHSVGMALLVHHNFPDEEANGVAVTNNPFSQGTEPAFFVNVQWGGKAEVVHPPAGVVSDQFLYFFDNPGQPITYISHSSLVPDGTTVLDARQTRQLGDAMKAIHERFSAAYGPAAGNQGWYAMDIEFKFDDDGSSDGKPTLWVKQARPYPGRAVTATK